MKEPKQKFRVGKLDTSSIKYILLSPLKNSKTFLFTILFFTQVSLNPIKDYFILYKIAIMITKAKLKEQIEKLPDSFTIDELVESLVFVGKVESGLNDSANDRKVSEKELEAKMKSWFA